MKDQDHQTELSERTFKSIEEENRRAKYWRCREKVLAAKKALYWRNPQKERDKSNLWASKNRGKVRTMAKEHYWKNRERILEYKRNRKEQRQRQEKKYGVSYPTWWLCDGCSKPISLYKGEIHLDHDHKTGKFRSWLCNLCNVTLGRLDHLENWQIERILELVH